ncbi:murein hydrolase activator EnvC family protein [Vibrio quintilis]|uniref:Murein hydrolase activator EnvC n=1 Tax=Vibrio quintilis TaxID=1117707 RepID=A0A1M7YT35_9VIBR|nr:peptidoglycan DD-metalloendopeptidase family protein [Vibrio quintilis]SHO55782.1 Murein hydrolase activator EnvC precursor [Vibrio quintilis]
MNQTFIIRFFTSIPAILFSAFCVLFTLFPQIGLSAPQQELQGVKTEISRQQSSLNKQSKQLDKLQSTLKRQELSISSLGKQIVSTKKLLRDSNQSLAKTEQKIHLIEKKKQKQEKQLGRLLHTYYMLHKKNSAEYLFKDDPNDDRIRQYYQHLAKARVDIIQQLNQTTQQLYDHEKRGQKERDKIKSLLAKQTAKHKELQKTQSKRRTTLRKIKTNISSNKNYLAELQRNESRLKAEMAKATKRNIVPMKGLSSRKGRLAWPLKGKLLHKFRTRQTGQVRWKGIVISASYGQAVKAVYSGTVVFSDYLRGYGLVVLVDHGKGDMTLYGFNQTLLKKEGERVSAGEKIALAGDTGGQPGPSLYFEIRRNSKAENPLNWLAR